LNLFAELVGSLQQNPQYMYSSWYYNTNTGFESVIW